MLFLFHTFPQIKTLCLLNKNCLQIRTSQQYTFFSNDTSIFEHFKGKNDINLILHCFDHRCLVPNIFDQSFMLYFVNIHFNFTNFTNYLYEIRSSKYDKFCAQNNKF